MGVTCCLYNINAAEASAKKARQVDCTALLQTNRNGLGDAQNVGAQHTSGAAIAATTFVMHATEHASWGLNPVQAAWRRSGKTPRLDRQGWRHALRRCGGWYGRPRMAKQSCSVKHGTTSPSTSLRSRSTRSRLTSIVSECCAWAQEKLRERRPL